VYRSEGGRTILSNEVTVCERCHALIHAGLLEVTGHPGEGLTWTPRPMAPGAKVRDAEDLRHRLDELARTLPPAPREAAPLASLSARVDAESTGRDWNLRRGRTAGATTESAAGGFSPRPNNCTLRTARVSTYGESNQQLRDLAEGLKRLGYSRAESMRCAEAAMEELIQAGNTTPSHEELVLSALRYRCGPFSGNSPLMTPRAASRARRTTITFAHRKSTSASCALPDGQARRPVPLLGVAPLSATKPSCRTGCEPIRLLGT
jgi:hypothetical protein